MARVEYRFDPCLKTETCRVRIGSTGSLPRQSSRVLACLLSFPDFVFGGLMEHLNSNSQNPIPCLSLRYCQARLSEVCAQRGGWIEPDRASSVRYCSACAPLVRREQSRLYKQKLRRQDWRKYHNEYSPFDKQQWREYLREYMRKWRARRKQTAMSARV
jgi:hypothetical protein